MQSILVIIIAVIAIVVSSAYGVINFTAPEFLVKYIGKPTNEITMERRNQMTGKGASDFNFTMKDFNKDFFYVCKSYPGCSFGNNEFIGEASTEMELQKLLKKYMTRVRSYTQAYTWEKSTNKVFFPQLPEYQCKDKYINMNAIRCQASQTVLTYSIGVILFIYLLI